MGEANAQIFDKINDKDSRDLDRIGLVGQLKVQVQVRTGFACELGFGIEVTRCDAVLYLIYCLSPFLSSFRYGQVGAGNEGSVT